jgi:periplasmic protein TonB
MVFLVTVGLHALVIAVLMTMKMGVPDVLKPFITTAEFLPPEPQVEKPPPELQVEKPQQQTLATFDLPDVVVEIPDMETPPNALELTPADVGPLTPLVEGPPTGDVARIPSTALQYSVVRPTDDYYPSQSLSLMEEGTAIVRVCVTSAGRLDGRPAIETTSGSPRLDAAALTWAREALRFKPATRDGVAVAACKGFRVNFKVR